MYVTDFICTYNKQDLSDQNTVYQQQFLQAFGLKEWDNEIIVKSTNELYNKVIDNQDIKDIINFIKKKEKDSILMLILGDKDIKMIYVTIYVCSNIYVLVKVEIFSLQVI